MKHAILRLVDGVECSGLTRAAVAGGGLLARRTIPDQVNYNLIRECLSICRLGHVHCAAVADVATIPGFQVIDCTTMGIIPAVEAQADGQEHDRIEYVTLSYVWGQTGCSVPVLRGDTLSLPDDIPLVVRDAFEVVRRLGYGYLWIDRYCIPQNDLPAKRIQIKKMETIFSCSVLTIIAAAGDGPEYGLPGVSSRHRIKQLSVQVSEEISLLFYKMPEVAFRESKWNTRGWTYQEGMLSKRRLVFTDEMIYFQCYEMHGDEVLSLPIPLSNSSGACDQHGQLDEVGYLSFEDKETNLGCIFPRQISVWSPNTAWARIEQFAQRKIAFDSDALDAISGIFGKYMSLNTSKAKENGISLFCGLSIAPFPAATEVEPTPTTRSMREV